MAQISTAAARTTRLGVSRVFTVLLGLASLSLLVYMLAHVVYQVVVPSPAHRILFVEDIPLPSGLGATSPGQTDPLAPGVQQDFDHFDFQAYDARTHRLF